MKPKFFKSRFIFPYIGARSNIKFSEGKAGVYIIADKHNHVCYIGYSGSQLEKTILRHFQSWTDPKQIRVSYNRDNGYKVRIVLTTPERAAALEKALIIKYRPKDNPNKLASYTLSVKDIRVIADYENEYARTITEMEEEAPF